MPDTTLCTNAADFPTANIVRFRTQAGFWTLACMKISHRVCTRACPRVRYQDVVARSREFGLRNLARLLQPRVAVARPEAAWEKDNQHRTWAMAGRDGAGLGLSRTKARQELCSCSWVYCSRQVRFVGMRVVAFSVPSGIFAPQQATMGTELALIIRFRCDSGKEEPATGGDVPGCMCTGSSIG